MSDMQPWSPFEIDGQEYLMKASFDVEQFSCTVIVTDLVGVWKESLDDKQLIVARLRVCQLSTPMTLMGTISGSFFSSFTLDGRNLDLGNQRIVARIRACQ